MSRVTVYKRDGNYLEFPETSAPGGSYSTTAKYEQSWLIVTDAYGKETAIPIDQIEKVVTEATPRW